MPRYASKEAICNLPCLGYFLGYRLAEISLLVIIIKVLLQSHP
jgi:hypothetical protein